MLLRKCRRRVNRNTAHFIRGDGTPRTWERRSTTNQREDRVSVVKDSKIRIFPVRETEPELQKSLSDWFQQEFGTTGFTWAAPAHYAISEIGGELIGRLGIFDRVIEIADTSMRVGGIGGVITKPEWRQRGIARELLTRAAAFMSGELGVEFAILLCRREVAPVYAKLGWIRVDGPTGFMQPSGMATYPRDTMVLRFTERQWPPGKIDMRGLPW
jgi:RimJ/RimL family protein N-acetyltransferase